jgi:hypothetical protein
VTESPALKAIARLKLRELEKQRDALLAAYETVEQRARDARTRRSELRALYRGLAEIAVAGEPMHPECKNLEGVLASGSPRLVRAATKRLRAEMERGRFRSLTTPTTTPAAVTLSATKLTSAVFSVPTADRRR